MQIVMVLTSRNWHDAAATMDFAREAGYAGDNRIFVNSDGHIWICAQRSSPPLGNIMDADTVQVKRAKEAAMAALRPGRCVSLECLVLR